jgi:hypothetical protein
MPIEGDDGTAFLSCLRLDDNDDRADEAGADE